MLCRFEDRIAKQALELTKFSHRIFVCTPEQLQPAFDQISAAQHQGCWIALLLDYELGEWLEPALSGVTETAAVGSKSDRPRMTALVYEQAQDVPVWQEPVAAGPITLDTRPLVQKNQYLENIDTLRAGIGRGDFYQVNYTFPIQVQTDAVPCDLYRTLAARHPSAHGAYIEDGQRTILSFSPELFMSRSGSTLTVRPMKGTAPRHADPVLDQQSAQELLQSEKNRAENLMIVDLLRHDLGRLATLGSVKVEALFSLECYPSVWTLTSTITAQAPDRSLQELLCALFPCGSITGAPKIAAMKKIKELERRNRGIYCGSVGWLAPNGDCSLNVAIRTIEMHSDQMGVFGVGGGIVYDSDPDLEWEECLWKARILQLGE